VQDQECLYLPTVAVSSRCQPRSVLTAASHRAIRASIPRQGVEFPISRVARAASKNRVIPAHLACSRRARRGPGMRHLAIIGAIIQLRSRQADRRPCANRRTRAQSDTIGVLRGSAVHRSRVGDVIPLCRDGIPTQQDPPPCPGKRPRNRRQLPPCGAPTWMSIPSSRPGQVQSGKFMRNRPRGVVRSESKGPCKAIVNFVNNPVDYHRPQGGRRSLPRSSA